MDSRRRSARSRIRMPFTLEEYSRGQLYCVAKMSKQESKKGEGVKVLINMPREHPEYGKGQYTKKVYYIASRLPAWIRKIIPKSFQTRLTLEEEAWNCFPYCKTVVTSGLFPDTFKIIIESWHAEDDGSLENALKLTPDELAKRKVEVMDIAAEPFDQKAAPLELDPRTFRSEKANRGPLTGNWHQTMKPMMTCYKVVKYEFKNFLLGGTVEKFMDRTERDIFVKFHRQIWTTLDEWFEMDWPAIRAYEDEAKDDLDRIVGSGAAEGDDAAADDPLAAAAAANSADLEAEIPAGALIEEPSTIDEEPEEL